MVLTWGVLEEGSVILVIKLLPAFEGVCESDFVGVFDVSAHWESAG